MSTPEQKKYDSLYEAQAVELEKKLGREPKGQEIEDEAWRLWFRWKSQTDTYFLATEVLDLFKTPRGKKRLDPKLHKKMCRELDRETDTMQLYPRGHLKTTFIRLWTTRKILEDPAYRIGYFSLSKELAMEACGVIKGWLAQPIIRELFGEYDIEMKKWELNQKDQFTISRAAVEGFKPSEAQFEAWGVGGTFTGHHYDYHVYDDIIAEKTVTTAAQIEKTRQWWSAVQPLKEPDAVDKVIGTHYHYQDIYATIAAEGWVAKGDIVVEKVERNGKWLYSFFNKKIFKRLTTGMTRYAINCQFYNDPRPTEDKFFEPPFPIFVPSMFPQRVKYYISIDPAATVRSYSDSTGICVAAVNIDNPSRAYFVEARKYRLKSNELAEKIIEKIVYYQPTRVGIETGLQSHLLALLQLKLRERLQDENFSRPLFVPLSTYSKGKADKFSNTIAAFVRDKRALLKATEDGEYHSDVADVVKQMDWYNPNSDGNEDDVIDAAAMMIQTIEHFAPAHWTGNKEKLFSYNMTFEQIVEEQKKREEGKENSWEYGFAC